MKPLMARRNNPTTLSKQLNLYLVKEPMKIITTMKSQEIHKENCTDIVSEKITKKNNIYITFNHSELLAFFGELSGSSTFRFLFSFPSPFCFLLLFFLTGNSSFTSMGSLNTSDSVGSGRNSANDGTGSESCEKYLKLHFRSKLFFVGSEGSR